jgi:hypothetical protein
MNGYSIVLFVHIVGALGFFMALGLEWAALYQARQTRSTEQLRTWVKVVNGSYRMGMPSMITLLLSGLYMTATVWGMAPWIMVSLGVLVLLVLLVITLIRPRLTTIEQALAVAEGGRSPALDSLVQHPQLWVTIQVRFALALSIIFLMTIKPDLNGALLTVASAIALALVATLPVLRVHFNFSERS